MDQRDLDALFLLPEQSGNKDCGYGNALWIWTQPSSHLGSITSQLGAIRQDTQSP